MKSRNASLLNRALDVLAETGGLPDARELAMRPGPWRIGARGMDAIFLIQLGRKRGRPRANEDPIQARLVRTLFVAQKRVNTQPGVLRASIPKLRELAARVPGSQPLIVTPFIGPGGKTLCRREGVSYVDATGNVGLFLDGGFIIKDGRVDSTRERRELRSLFAPRATRVIRILLENKSRSWLFQELADAASVSLGQAYKVVQKLTAEEFVGKTERGIKLANPAGLLDRWASAYVVTRDNAVESYYSDEASYRRLMEKLAESAGRVKSRYAFTLFAGASLVAPFVRTPQVHLYLLEDGAGFAEAAGLKPVTSGGNVHLIRPYDEGVLNPLQTIEGLNVVGNVQLYLDLVNYPARGKEQAEEVRRKVIGY